MYAAKSGHEEVVKVLALSGASIDVQSKVRVFSNVQINNDL